MADFDSGAWWQNGKPDPHLPKNAIAPGSEFYGKVVAREGRLLEYSDWYDVASERLDCIYGFCILNSKTIVRYEGILHDNENENGYDYDATLELETTRTWTFAGSFLDLQRNLPSIVPGHGLVSETRQFVKILVRNVRKRFFPDPMTTTTSTPTEKVSRPSPAPIFRNDTKHSLKSGERFRPAPYDKRYRPGGKLYEAY
jgi:hypothetical protein